MTPAQFLSRLKRRNFAPAYLFLGPDAYERRRAREALIRAVLGDDDRENAVTMYDLNEASLADVVDDARCLSLFAPQRVIVASNAESALPRGRSEEAGEEEAGGASAQALNDYMRDPSPVVVLVFEAARFDFEGEDKKKLERVRKFYSAIAEAVEFRRPSVEDARSEAQALARRAGLSIETAALDLLVEALGADVQRISVEVEKLALYAAGQRTIAPEDITAMVPDARASNIFALVNALGRRDRARSLAILDTLTREGEYLPLALAFLSAQFRMAMVAKETGLRSPQQIQSHFSRMGVAMWSSKAEQVYQTVSKFSKEQLMRSMELIYRADKGLRDARPDDRIVMEQFVLELTV